MRVRILTIMVAIGLLALGMGNLGGVRAAPSTPPDEVVRQTAERMLDAIEGRRKELEQKPEKLHQLVDEILRPRFDLEYAARLVLARHWRHATPKQQDRFIEVFYNYLVRTYSQALLGYKQGQVEVLPFRGNTTDPYVKVRTKFHRSDGPPVPVHYALHETSEGWQVFDVIVEGISYVNNYRNTFKNEIRKTSLDALIERLSKKGKPTNPFQRPGSGKRQSPGAGGE